MFDILFHTLVLVFKLNVRCSIDADDYKTHFILVTHFGNE